MPIIHVLEIGAISQHENTACPIRYQKLLPETFGTKWHVRRVRNRYRFSGTDFWRRFLVSMSWA